MKHPVRHMWSALGFILAAGISVIAVGKFREMPSDEVSAAWVQAIGSVVAILAAVYIGLAQVMAARALARAQSSAVDRAARNALNHASGMLVAVAKAVEADAVFHEGVMTRQINMAQARLDAIPSHQVLDVNVQNAMLVMGLYLSGATTFLPLTAEAEAKFGKMPDDVIKIWAGYARDALKLAALEIDDVIV